jgi:hypothetical protein
MKLISENFGGNTHDTVATINRWKMAKYVLQIDTTSSGMNTVVVFRVPDDFDLGEYLKQDLNAYIKGVTGA